MSRPEVVTDLPDYDRAVTLAHFYTADFVDQPELLRAYADFVEHVKVALKGKVDANAVTRPKTDAEQDEALGRAQRDWDRTAKRYEAVYNAVLGHESFADLKWYDYEASGLRNWAKTEGQTVFALISADEALRKKCLEEVITAQAEVPV